MIYYVQDGYAVQCCFVDQRLVGPDPVPLVPYRWYCTTTAEQGHLRVMGIRATLSNPPSCPMKKSCPPIK